MTSMYPTYTKTVTEPLNMIFKLRNEHNSHSCVWYTFTQARTQACEKAKMLHQNTKKNVGKIMPLSRDLFQKQIVAHFVYQVFLI